MSKDDIFNKLCSIFFLEEQRLSEEVELMKYKLRHSFDSETMVEYIKASARLEYFKKYILDVLKFLETFDG